MESIVDCEPRADPSPDAQAEEVVTEQMHSTVPAESALSISLKVSGPDQPTEIFLEPELRQNTYLGLEAFELFWEKQIPCVRHETTDPVDPTFEKPVPFASHPLSGFRFEGKQFRPKPIPVLIKPKKIQTPVKVKKVVEPVPKPPATIDDPRWILENQLFKIMWEKYEKTQRDKIALRKKYLALYPDEAHKYNVLEEEEYLLQAAGPITFAPTDPLVILGEIEEKYGSVLFTEERVEKIKSMLSEPQVFNWLMEQYRKVWAALQGIKRGRSTGKYHPTEEGLTQLQIQEAELLGYETARRKVDDFGAGLLLKETLFYPSTFHKQRLPESDVRNLIWKCFVEFLHPRIYQNNDEEMAEITGQMSSSITDKILALGCVRYKIITHVTLGEYRGQELQTMTKCHWDDFSDRLICENYVYGSILCNLAVYAIYYY